MADYIDREKAKHIIDSELGCYDTTELEEMLSYFPREDATPVVYGKWILRGGWFRCSACDSKANLKDTGGTGGYSHEYEQVKSKVCHECGAKMDL